MKNISSHSRQYNLSPNKLPWLGIGWADSSFGGWTTATSIPNHNANNSFESTNGPSYIRSIEIMSGFPLTTPFRKLKNTIQPIFNLFAKFSFWSKRNIRWCLRLFEWLKQSWFKLEVTLETYSWYLETEGNPILGHSFSLPNSLAKNDYCWFYAIVFIDSLNYSKLVYNMWISISQCWYKFDNDTNDTIMKVILYDNVFFWWR